jgi:hypothetical protein
MLLALLLPSAALTPAEGACVPRAPLSIDIGKLRVAAHRLFVANGSADTMAYSDLPSVETIDRHLTVSFDLPELSVTADGSSPFNETCGRSWRCGCLQYEVCPGMELTSAMTRGFAAVATENGGPPNLAVRTLNGFASEHSMHDLTVCGVFPQMPLYDWDATMGKEYSLLFVERMRTGFPRGIVVHYFAYNVCNSTAVTKDLHTTLGGWRAPNHGRVGSPGLNVHLLFEHEAGLTVDLSAAMRIASSDAATDLTAFMVTVGLHNATLVSLNWMAVRGSILSHTSIDADRCVRNLLRAPLNLRRSVQPGTDMASLQV